MIADIKTDKNNQSAGEVRRTASEFFEYRSEAFRGVADTHSGKNAGGYQY